MTSPLPQVLVAGVEKYIQYKKLWSCGNVEYATAHPPDPASAAATQDIVSC